MGDLAFGSGIAQLPAEIELQMLRERLVRRTRPGTHTGILKADMENQEQGLMAQEQVIAELREQLAAVTAENERLQTELKRWQASAQSAWAALGSEL